jgi:hypothetical protein
MFYLVVVKGKCENKYLNGCYNNRLNFEQNFIWNIKAAFFLLK